MFLAVVAGVKAVEPPMEVMVLADGERDSDWHSAEATMLPDSTHAVQGRAMRFRVDVNHDTGQPDYPIGWPRTYMNIPVELRDWRKWDFLEFWIYADTSRERLPNTPLGFIVRSPNRAKSYQKSVHELQKGEWIQVRVPTSDMPTPAECTAVQFFVSESNYQHGDVLDFWIDGLVLLRYAEPTMISVRPMGQVHHADASSIRIEVRMTGLEEGETAQLSLRLLRNGKTVRRSAAEVLSGSQSVALEVGDNLEVGRYELRAQVAASKRIITTPLRVISSPWEEEIP
jgi:hypothetical protein